MHGIGETPGQIDKPGIYKERDRKGDKGKIEEILILSK